MAFPSEPPDQGTTQQICNWAQCARANQHTLSRLLDCRLKGMIGLLQNIKDSGVRARGMLPLG